MNTAKTAHAQPAHAQAIEALRQAALNRHIMSNHTSEQDVMVGATVTSQTLSDSTPLLEMLNIDTGEGSELQKGSNVQVLRTWLRQNLKLIIYIIMYVSISIGLTLFNKWLLAVHNFQFPILIVTVDFVALFIFSIFMCIRRWDQILASDFSPRKITFMQYCTNFVHVGISTGADTLLTQLTLITSTITLCEVIKSGVPVLVLLFSVCQRGNSEKFTRTKAAIVSTISIGIFLTTYGGELTSSVIGIITASGSTVSAALRLVFMQGLLQDTGSNGGKISSFLALAYMLPSAIMSLVVMLVPIEGADMENSNYFSMADDGGLGTTVLFLSGHLVMSISLRVFETYVISHSSALTVCVVGVGKLVIEIILSIMIFGDPLSVINVFGVAIALAAAGWYNYDKFTSYRVESLKNSKCNSSRFGWLQRQFSGYGRKDSYQSICTQHTMYSTESLPPVECGESLPGGGAVPVAATSGGSKSPWPLAIEVAEEQRLL